VISATFLLKKYAFRNPLGLHHTAPCVVFLLLKPSYPHLQPFVDVLPLPTLLPNFPGKKVSSLLVQLEFLPLSEKQQERRSRGLENP